jgi:hypothetical protein
MDHPMLFVWRVFNRVVLVILVFLVSLDAYAWIGPEAPDRLFSSVLIGFMAALLWAMFGAGVRRML